MPSQAPNPSCPLRTSTSSLRCTRCCSPLCALLVLPVRCPQEHSDSLTKRQRVLSRMKCQDVHLCAARPAACPCCPGLLDSGARQQMTAAVGFRQLTVLCFHLSCVVFCAALVSAPSLLLPTREWESSLARGVCACGGKRTCECGKMRESD